MLVCGDRQFGASPSDQSHDLLEAWRAPTLPGVGLSWEELGGKVSGIVAPSSKIESHHPFRPGSTRRIRWADAALFDPHTGEITTVEHGWFRGWRQIRPATRE